MKCLGFLLLFGFISLGAIGGCNNNGGGQDGTRALTENDFANDTTLRANPEKHLVVKFLEHPDSEKPDNDTGGVGNDVIPLTYTRTLEHTFCWEDDDGEAGHFMELDDSDGNEIFRLDVNGECITVVLEAGDYVMTIHHDGMIETTHPIFMIPSNEDDLEVNTGTDWLIKSGKVLLSNILQNLLNTITKNVKAQTVAKNVRTLLKTNACPACNLAGADLTGADLFQANLAGADLTGAVLTFANLATAKLDDATLTDANLLGTNLVGADLTGATWCDGSICLAGSTGTCELMERYLDNCDRTISDTDTGLMWEKKDSPGGGDACPGGATCDNPHDVNNYYTWSSTGSATDGSAFTDFLEKLNNGCNNDPTVDCTAGGAADCVTAGVGGACGFAAHRDWRLPEMGKEGGKAELETILDLSEANCSSGGSCINSIFGPTSTSPYWSATSLASNPAFAWYVSFIPGFVKSINKTHILSVRAVRNSP